MTSRERMLTAISNGRPDRLPCTVHNWMTYYLNTYLGGADVFEAYERFGMDYAIYTGPAYKFDQKTLENWRVETVDLGPDDSGNQLKMVITHTPEGDLFEKRAENPITPWTLEYPIKTDADFEIWNKYFPVPSGVDFTEVRKLKDRLGDKGIIRSFPYSPGQGSPWQSLCIQMGTEESIMKAMDEPEFIHYALDSICKRTERVAELWAETPNYVDVVETGGGAGSNTVISPTFFEEFCLPYDKRQHDAIHKAGVKIVYHLCGGIMKMLDLVVENGADGLETMTPVSMGGDCDLAEASRLVGDKLFFVGGFDQNAGFEIGTPYAARKLVFECFEATKDHAGYICAPSDHFFRGAPENIQAFVNAAKECVY